MSHVYKFATSEDAMTWDTVVRLAGGVGWDLEFDERAVATLRAHVGHREASRTQVTRAEFVAQLCADAGVPYEPRWEQIAKERAE